MRANTILYFYIDAAKLQSRVRIITKGIKVTATHTMMCKNQDAIEPGSNIFSSNTTRFGFSDVTICFHFSARSLSGPCGV